MSQELLAEKADLSPGYVSLLERSQRNLTAYTALNIAAALHMSLTDLVQLAESDMRTNSARPVRADRLVKARARG